MLGADDPVDGVEPVPDEEVYIEEESLEARKLCCAAENPNVFPGVVERLAVPGREIWPADVGRGACSGAW